MLEIGTIVYLKRGTQKLMILNRGVVIQKNDKNTDIDKLIILDGKIMKSKN